MKVFTGAVRGHCNTKRYVHRVTVTLPLEARELAQLHAGAITNGITVEEACRRILLVAFFGYRGTFPPPTPAAIAREALRGFRHVEGRFSCYWCRESREVGKKARISLRRENARLRSELVTAKHRIAALEVEIARRELEIAHERVTERAA